MFYKFLLTVLFLSSYSVFSQIPWQILNDGAPIESKHEYENDHCKDNYQYLRNEALQSNLLKRIYDVLNYDISIDVSKWLRLADSNLSPINVIFDGKQTMTLVIDSAGHSSIEIDAALMDIKSVGISSPNSNGNFSYDYQSPTLKVNKDSDFQINDTLKIVIVYSVNRPQRIGLYMFGRGGEGNSEVIEPVVYNQSEPTEAHFWFPCNDRPYDKVFSRLSIIVPEGFTGLSNGLLDSISTIKGGTANNLEYFYSHQSLISPYLITMVASKYSYFEQLYPRFTNNLDTMIIGNYMWDIDLNPPNPNTYNAKKALRNQPEMLRYFSSLFGEYAFEKYGTVAVSPYKYGGMEHQTMTTIHRNWLRGNSETGIAHEAAHHWIGNLVTCASWSDIWMNEGGASWYEALWKGHVANNEDEYYNQCLGQANYYFSNPDAVNYPIYNVPEPLIFVKTYITYSKASWIYHMLSEMIGRDEFFQVMYDIFEMNKFAALTTAEFVNQIKANTKSSKIDLDLFFEQWLYGSGHPIYSVTASFPESEPGKYAYEVYISQVQEGSGFREVFEMPIELLFTDKDGNILASKPVYNDSRNQKFNFEFDFPINGILVDYRKVLCEQSEIVVSAKNQVSQIGNVLIAPNPVNSDTQLSLFSDSSINIIEIRVYDMLGNAVSTKKGNSGFSINSLKAPSNKGIYLIEIIFANGSIQKETIVVV